MRILMIEPGGWGGICHYTYNLSTALADHNTSLMLLTARPYELADYPHHYQVHTPFEAPFSYGAKIRATFQIHRQYHPDIIHIQSTFSARKDWLLFFLCKQTGIPVVFTAHNVLPHDESEKTAPGMQFAYRQIYRFARHIIVHSADSHRTLNALFSPKKEKVSIIPHGNYVFADNPEITTRAEARIKLNLPLQGRMLLAFGTIRPYKGTEDLIEAFADVASHHPDCFLVIAGKPIGTDPKDIQNLIAKHSLTHQVIFRPEYIAMKDIAPYFQASDIAVYPYHAIYQSGALQLAYAFSRPVVATEVGAFPETIDTGQNGILVPPHNPSNLTQALIHMLQKSDEELLAMGKHSRFLADTRYAWSSVAEQTHRVYQNLIRCH